MSNTTKRSAVALSAVIALVMGAVLTVLLLATDQTRADGTPPGEQCEPKDAWTETTDWVLVSPGNGWYQTDEKVVSRD